GRQKQTPPMYSALKRAGQPLYRLARSGVTVERAAREVELFELELLRLETAGLELEILCSKGTYVRALAEDLAQALGTCGHATAPASQPRDLSLSGRARSLKGRASAAPVPARAGRCAGGRSGCTSGRIQRTRRPSPECGSPCRKRSPAGGPRRAKRLSPHRAPGSGRPWRMP